MLNWTSILPRQQVVAWELWTSTNDECTMCKERLDFVKVRVTLSND